MVRSINFCTT